MSNVHWADNLVDNELVRKEIERVGRRLIEDKAEAEHSKDKE